MKIRMILALCLLCAVLALPFLFRQKDRSIGDLLDTHPETIVIISAHAEPMKFEYEQAFRKYYREKTGKNITIDWRSVGGTSDIVRYIADRYKAEFRHFWESDSTNPPWSGEIAAAFANPRILRDPKASPAAKLARKKFLESGIGIGIDLFAGGGSFEQKRMAQRGYAVDGGLQKRHPEYFRPDRIPHFFGGEEIYEKDGKYYGVCLSSFGICYNRDRIRELNGAAAPKRWSDLGKAEFFRNVVVADPTKSGSANKCFEIILQQEMGKVIPPGNHDSGKMDQGWANGLNLIKRIVANTRSVTDSAGKVVRDVSSGHAAVGMAIDFYGLTEKEWNEFQTGGNPSIVYVAPEGGTALSADPIQLLRGAPHREAAQVFLDFMVGPTGQKLLDFKVGTPGGPVKYALRRSPVLMSLYQDQYKQFRADPDYYPYRAGATFTYHPDWTGRYFSLIRLLIRCLALDVQDELREAWQAILEAGGPEKVPQAYRKFCQLPFPYHQAPQEVVRLQKLQASSAIGMAAACREWSDQARMQYNQATRLAKEGK